MSGEPSPDPPAVTGGRRPLSGPQRLINTVIAVVLLVELVALLGHPVFGWGDKFYAATPSPLTYHAPEPLSGDAVLLRLAEQAARQVAVSPGSSATYAYVERQTWQLADAGSGQRGHVLPTVTQSWRGADGTERVVRFVRGPSGVNTRRATVGTAAPPPDLSPSPAVLARQLQSAAAGAPAPQRDFLGLVNLTDAEPISPPVQAAALTLLAHIPDVTNSGTVTDRDGRAGVAVSVEPDSSGPLTRYTLIFDPVTGALLEADQTVVGESQDPSVREGSVVAYTTFLRAGHAASETAQP